jgi:hypothetical protein
MCIFNDKKWWIQSTIKKGFINFTSLVLNK